eukprot:scaffold183217_cov16-Tisochrysis_lutea.AAC.1
MLPLHTHAVRAASEPLADPPGFKLDSTLRLLFPLSLCSCKCWTATARPTASNSKHAAPAPSVLCLQLQALDADRTPHADQDGGSGSGQRGRAASHVHTSNAVSWAAGASPLGRPSGPETPGIAASAVPPMLALDKQHATSDTGPSHVKPAAAVAKAPVSSPTSPFAASPFAAGAARVSCFSAAAAPLAAEKPASSMASAAAAAVAAVDAEHAALEAAAVAGGRNAGAGSCTWRSRPGSSSSVTAQSLRMEHSAGGEEVMGHALEGGGDGGVNGAGDVGAGGHPRLRVCTGREAWGSGEVSPQGSEEEQACLHAASQMAAVALLQRGEKLGGEEVQYGPGEVSPLPSPKLCATPMPAKGDRVGPRPPFKGADMSSYQIQRAYEIEASRASVPEMLL